MRSNTPRTRPTASAGLVIFGIPTVGTNHQFSGEMPRSNAQQYFLVAGLRVHPANTHFVKLQNELSATQDYRQLFPSGHLPQQLEPDLHCARIGISELFRVSHKCFTHNASLCASTCGIPIRGV
jgi:hypothetical protein